MSTSERNRLLSSRIVQATVVCHGRMAEQQTIGRRRLYDAVVELWGAVLLNEWNAADAADKAIAEWREVSRA